MSEDDRQRLEDMLSYATRAVRSIQGRGRTDLYRDEDFAELLTYRVIMIGEAASRASRSLANDLPEIPWADVTGIRHRLLHDYTRINFDILWATVSGDLPELIVVLEKVLAPRR